MSLASPFFYGSFTHRPFEISFRSFNKSLILGGNGRPHVERWDWSLRCRVVYSGSGVPIDDVQTRILQIIDAYASGGQSCGFPATAFLINNNDTIGGTLVTSPVSFGKVEGSEGVNYLESSIGIQADFPFAGVGQVLSFQESMSFTDNAGQPIFVERIPQSGLPILQQVTTNSWYYGTQSGSIETAFAVGQPMAPLFPGLLRTSSNAGQNLVYNSPQMMRGTPTSYVTSWKYEYISPVSFFSFPNTIG